MRLPALLWAALLSLACALPAYAAPPTPPIANASPAPAQPVAPLAPSLLNPNMECSQGFGAPPDGTPGTIPYGWTWRILSGRPQIDSWRWRFTGQHCDANGFAEKIEGNDSWGIFSEDIETPPNPGKPFDAYIYQQTAVTPGKVYSLSGWMVSFCGGTKSNPNDCPAGYYISKMLGLDPTGGTDPTAPTVIWTEDRRNFTESRWVQMRIGATAQANTMTVFARISSPFLHHGAFALMDAISLLEGPTAQFTNVPAQVAGPNMDIQWCGALTPDITGIPAGTHQLFYDVEYKRGQSGAWQPWLGHSAATSATFHPTCAVGADQDYIFRVRPLAEQPEGVPGAWPNHRYLGVWTTSTVLACDTTPPVAGADDATTAEDTAVVIQVLANDSDPEADDVLSVAAAGTPTHGTATTNGTTITYTPARDFNGTDTFAYTLSDGSLTSTGRVTVHVTAAPDPPRLTVPTCWLTAQGTHVRLPIQAYDPDNDPITFSAEGLPPGLQINADTGVISGDSPTGITGVYQVTVIASDSTLSSSMSISWRVIDHVWRTGLPITSRP